MKDKLNLFDGGLQESGKQELKDQQEQEFVDKFVEDDSVQNLVSFVQSKFYKASLAKRPQEERALDYYRQWRGEYSPQEKAAIEEALSRSPGACQAFVKVTKTKVQAGYGQLLEVLFANGKFPIGIKASNVPEGIAETVHVAPPEEPSGDIYGYNGDGKEIAPGENSKSLLGGLYDKYANMLKKSGQGFKEGASPDPNAPVLHPAEVCAKNAEDLIVDQLTDKNAEMVLQTALYEAVIYGTMIIKGPYSCEEITHKYERNETGEIEYKPYVKVRPKIKHVSFWNYYPDPSSALDHCEWQIERHLLSKFQLRELSKLANTSKKAIAKVLEKEPVHARQWFESEIKNHDNQYESDSYEGLEYWGYIDKEMLEYLPGIDLPLSEYESTDNIPVGILVCQGEVISVQIMPYLPIRNMYIVCPYEKHPHERWGIGIPENMTDLQSIMNANVRMSIDNLRLSGSIMLEVNEGQLAPGQDFSIYNGKVWRKTGGAPGQSIYPLTVPNVSGQHLQIYDKMRQLADETTNMPSYSHGGTNVSGTNRTAMGMSMLMGAAALNIKTVVKNIDFYLLKPLADAYYQWNMQYNDEDIDFRGDVKIVAQGTSSLMQREVLSQRLLSLLQLTANPQVAVHTKIPEIIKGIVQSMDLDPDKYTNDIESAKVMAQLMGEMNNVLGQGNNQEANGIAGAANSASPATATGGINPADSSGHGGGVSGIGSPPEPGQA